MGGHQGGVLSATTEIEVAFHQLQEELLFSRCYDRRRTVQHYLESKHGRSYGVLL
jgi:hypothetical protein